MSETEISYKNISSDEIVRDTVERLWERDKNAIDRGFSTYSEILKDGQPKTLLSDYRWKFDGIDQEEFAEMLAAGKILDAGCGKGGFVKDCLEKGYDAYGLDLALTEQAAVSKVKETNPEVIGRIVAADATAIPFASGTFSLIMNIYSAPNYVFDPGKVSQLLEEEIRVATENGRIVIYPINFLDGVPRPTNYIEKVQKSGSGEVVERGKRVEEAFGETLTEMQEKGLIVIERHIDKDLENEENPTGGGYIIIRKLPVRSGSESN